MIIQPRQRVPEIDWLKGACILCVLLIHARPIDGPIALDQLINRAVPIFIVLFGTTSEIWWQRHSADGQLRAWYRERMKRMMLPVWGALLLWWPMVWVFPISLWNWDWRHVAASAAGYTPWIGTGWFITLILELVVLFPVIRWTVVRAGTAAAYGATLLIMTTTILYRNELISSMKALFQDSAGGSDEFYLWIFFPLYLPNIVAGIAIARGDLSINRWTASIAAGLLVAGIWLQGAASPLWVHALRAAIDVPQAIFLLWVFGHFGRMPALVRFLAWCGASTWGIYIGQMLVHDTIHRLIGFPEVMATPIRWVYLAALFVGAIGFVFIGSAIRETRVSDLFAGRARRDSLGAGSGVERPTI